MLTAVLRFGLGTYRRSVSIYVYLAIFAAAALLAMLGSGGAIESSLDFSEDQVKVNSPYVLNDIIGALSSFGMLVIAAIAGRAACRDFECRIDSLFFTAPISKTAYLGGRFLEAVTVLVAIFAAIGVGLYAGAVTPGMDPLKLGPNRFMAYLQPYLILVIPNIIILSALFFSLALVARKMAAVYSTSILLLCGYLAAATVSDKIENRWIASLLDPFGNEAADRATHYWTIFEKNTRLLAWEGPLLWNRVLWLAMSAAVLLAASRAFRMEYAVGRAVTPGEAAPMTGKASCDTPPRHSSAAALVELVRTNFLATVRSVYFGAILLAGIGLMILEARDAGSIYATPTWPVTYQMVDVASSGFTLFMLVLIIFYAGDLVWRERDAGVHELADALPLPGWVPFTAKLVSLCLVPVVVQIVLILTGMSFQLAMGYQHLQPLLYVQELLGLRLVYYLLVCVLAFTVQVIVNHKYVGHAVMIAYYLVLNFMGRFAFEHPLYKYGSTPGHIYSDMDGFGEALAGELWSALYWAAFAILLAVLARLFWVRGLATDWRWRQRLARARFHGTPRFLALGAFLVFACVGGLLFYNSNIRNEYHTTLEREAIVAHNELRYKRYAKIPQPSITAVNLRVELDPPHGGYRVKGRYEIANKTARPVEQVLVTVPLGPGSSIHTMQMVPAAAVESQDRHASLRIYRMAQPMAPGAAGSLEFDIEQRSTGFYGDNTMVVGNGSFLNNDAFPHFGYNDDAELSGDAVRRRHHLPPKPRAADINDREARRRNDTSRDADWVSMDITIGTTPDQIAVAPGELVRDWRENGRRYFEYRTLGKALEFSSMLSARYRELRDQWNGVALSIYYHPGHEYNLTSMMEGMKAALAYCTENFSPYQNRSLRILEFPRYGGFAQSFLASIPYSESMGFLSRVDPQSETDVDFPYFVTAHEVAHQWWGHQAVGANVQGSAVISESLAEYTALMVMKRKYGEQRMAHFLRYVLDQYLNGRSSESNHELPLVRAENQSYLHYYKGGLAFYALQDYVGEAELNRALRSYLHKVAYQEAPYTTALELEASVREVMPPQYAYLIDDLFDSITLYENRAISATYRQVSPGKYEVKLKVAAKKLKADGIGTEKAAALADWIDIGVLDAKGKPLYLAKQKIEKPETEFTLTVDGVPAKAGIDPWNKLVDRTPEDNLIAVRQ